MSQRALNEIEINNLYNYIYDMSNNYTKLLCRSGQDSIIYNKYTSIPENEIDQLNRSVYELHKENMILLDEINYLQKTKPNTKFSSFELLQESRCLNEEINRLLIKYTYTINKEIESIYCPELMEYYLDLLTDSNILMSSILLNLKDAYNEIENSEQNRSQYNLDTLIRLIIQINENYYGTYINLIDKFEEEDLEAYKIEEENNSKLHEILHKRIELYEKIHTEINKWITMTSKYGLKPTEDYLEELEIDNWRDYLKNLTESNTNLYEKSKEIVENIFFKVSILEFKEKLDIENLIKENAELVVENKKIHEKCNKIEINNCELEEKIELCSRTQTRPVIPKSKIIKSSNETKKYCNPEFNKQIKESKKSILSENYIALIKIYGIIVVKLCR